MDLRKRLAKMGKAGNEENTKAHTTFHIIIEALECIWKHLSQNSNNIETRHRDLNLIMCLFPSTI